MSTMAQLPLKDTLAAKYAVMAYERREALNLLDMDTLIKLKHCKLKSEDAFATLQA